MPENTTYDSFPARIILISNLAAIAIYISGIYIMSDLGWAAASVYLAFLLSLEYRLISRHCVNCYYWGKLCGFGKGSLSSLAFKKGDQSKFCEKEMKWKDLIPDLLVSLIPVVTGVVLLFTGFRIDILIAIMVLAVLTTAGNRYIRVNLTCRHCRQREIGCPAEKLFNETSKQAGNAFKMG